MLREKNGWWGSLRNGDGDDDIIDLNPFLLPNIYHLSKAEFNKRIDVVDLEPYSTNWTHKNIRITWMDRKFKQSGTNRSYFSFYFYSKSSINSSIRTAWLGDI